jgi:hypothetical protein
MSQKSGFMLKAFGTKIQLPLKILFSHQSPFAACYSEPPPQQQCPGD